jgi:drug/metabolite transporter (DMT)-like permease
MIKGILFTLLACFFWGFTFVIPALLTNFSSIEIALGRYFIFGIISVILFGLVSFRELIQYPIHFWLKALLFSLVGNIIYFASLVFAVKYSSPSITTLIVGIAPVTTAFYGNWKERECSFSKLVLPSILIALGLVIINVESLLQSETNLLNPQYLFGLLCACVTLISFTWYTISNASFLKKNHTVGFFEWTTMMGVMTFLLVILIIIPMIPFIESSHIEKYSVWTSEMQHFTFLIAILGIFCSWLSTFLWSSGCVLLPVSLGGQMSIFKTVFGLLFVYMYEQRFPSFLEFLGIFMIFIAIYSTINIFAKAKTNYAAIV